MAHAGSRLPLLGKTAVHKDRKGRDRGIERELATTPVALHGCPTHHCLRTLKPDQPTYLNV